LIIVCNSCSTQYSVNDAKVRGKLVRITCKHCASAIVVDGRQMSEVSVAVPSQKPLPSYALPRRDESVVAHAPLPSLAPARAPAAAPAPMPTAMSAALREDDRTMVTRSKFGDDMSVHDERTVIGQIPKEALEFERMFAQRTQPPPPDAPKAPTTSSPPIPAVPSSPQLPSFADEQSDDREQPKDQDGVEDRARSEAPAASNGEHASRAGTADENEDATADVPVEAFSRSEPPTLGSQPTSDARGLVSLAEATHPSVARAVSARRLRVTLVALLVLAALVFFFVIRTPR
jgi:predicted Zn finger-like uncharacterized protein